MKKASFLFACFLLCVTSFLCAQNFKINSPEDDAEESAGFAIVSVNSPIIDLTADPTNTKFMKQIVGLRFTNVNLDKGTALSNCYLAFNVDQPANKNSMLTIQGEKAANALAFQEVNRNISSRIKTKAKLFWNNVEAWNETGAVMRSIDISPILMEIISQPDWIPGNSIVLLIEGYGQRHATAYDKNPELAAQLVLNGGSIIPVASSKTAQAEQKKSVQAPEVPQAAPAQQAITTPQAAPVTQQPGTASSKMKSGTSLEEIINTSQAPATVGLASQIEVTIPQGVAPEGTKVTINKANKEYKCDEINILNAIDVKLSSGETFQKPLEIKMYFDKGKLSSSGNTENIRPAYFNEGKKQWVEYPDYSVNEQEGSVSFKTSHLTVISLFEFLTTGFYTLKLETPDCNVFYSLNDTHVPMKNSDYNDFKTEPWYIKEGEKDSHVSYLVQDIAHWVGVVKRSFRDSLNLKVTRKINVYVRQITDFWGNPSAWGEYGSVAGCIYMNNKQVSPVQGVTNSEFLRSNVAHEYLHLVQDNYYVMNKGMTGLWWLEAFATQADCMAYKNHKNCESEVWAQKLLAQSNPNSNIENHFLENAMATGWDNSSAEYFYGAGFFLRYLAYFRPEKKLDLAKLMIEGGSNTDLSYFRTILNKHLSDNFKSSINQEYENFAKWVYNNNESKLKFFISSSWDQNHKVLKIEDSFTSSTLTEKLSPLSCIILKLKRWSDTQQDFKLERELQSLSPGVKVFLCDSKTVDGPRVVIKELKVKANDQQGMTFTETTSLSKTNTSNDFLVVNTNPDNEGSFTMLLKNTAKPKP